MTSTRPSRSRSRDRERFGSGSGPGDWESLHDWPQSLVLRLSAALGVLPAALMQRMCGNPPPIRPMNHVVVFSRLLAIL